MDQLFKKFPETTFIAICHKLNVLDKFDTVIVINNGSIVEKGTPQEILKSSSIRNLVDI